MDNYLSLKQNKRQRIRNKIEKSLYQEEEIVFAYIFGSFVDSPSFRDIDIGVYIKKISPDKINDYEFNLTDKIAAVCNLPIDVIEVKVLNYAPFSFLNNIFSKGQFLFSKDNKFFTDLIEKTSLSGLANEHISRQSLKELIPT